ncbi:hypothetical protein LWI29_037235 [Acer saccharum]|uniref:DUF1985 domain-containing protein n=1 Tax=Acer saccharum TaxID=4024 RepID=A0AA39TK47_ACESA|nr:hypothetical protein LWI29_037235 [Acer saccharum]
MVWKGMLRRWEHGVFGQFISMGKGKQFFSGKLCHLLLCREVVHPYGRPDEMWFRVGGRAIKFRKEEFLLLTGLRFRSLPKGAVTQYISTPSNVHHRYFHGLPTHLEDIIHKLREVEQFDLEDDVLKLGYVFFLSHILLGRDYRRIVPNWLWGMVEDVIAFEAYHWGTYIYSLTIYWLGKALKGRIDKKKQNRQQNGEQQNEDSSKSQDIGYYYWAMEAIPKLTGVVGVQRGDGFPRVRRWYDRKKSLNLQKEFTNELEALTLTPTPSDEERRQACYLHFDPDQFVGPLKHKDGGLGDDSEDDEDPNVRGKRCRAPMGRGRGRGKGKGRGKSRRG